MLELGFGEVGKKKERKKGERERIVERTEKHVCRRS